MKPLEDQKLKKVPQDPWKLWSEWLTQGTRLPPQDGTVVPDDQPLGCFYGHLADFQPVGIWQDRMGLWVCKVDGKFMDPANTWKRLTYKPKPGSPTTYEAYLARVKHGTPFPKELEAKEEEEKITPSIGHNLPPEGLPNEPAQLKELLDEYERILDQEAKAPDLRERAAYLRLSKLADRIAEIEKHATNLFEIEKAPWLKGGRETDDKWRDVRVTSTKLKTRAKKGTLIFIQAQTKRAQLEAAKTGLPMVKERLGGTVLKRREVAKIVDMKKFVLYLVDLGEAAPAEFNSSMGSVAMHMIVKGMRDIPGVEVEVVEQAV